MTTVTAILAMLSPGAVLLLVVYLMALICLGLTFGRRAKKGPHDAGEGG